MEIFQSLINKSWINNFTPVIKQSYVARVQPTIEKITKELHNGQLTAVDRNSGELVVSELSRKTVVRTYNYVDIPIAELFKPNRSQNSCFDFYSVNLNNVILFGEAKYVNEYTASKKALDQIEDFVTNKKKDDIDIADIDRFVSKESIKNYGTGLKGYIAAFSSKEESDDDIIDKIINLNSFKELRKYTEVICVAVNI
jgi:hypothetical protein